MENLDAKERKRDKLKKMFSKNESVVDETKPLEPLLENDDGDKQLLRDIWANQELPKELNSEAGGLFSLGTDEI